MPDYDPASRLLTEHRSVWLPFVMAITLALCAGVKNRNGASFVFHHKRGTPRAIASIDTGLHKVFTQPGRSAAIRADKSRLLNHAFYAHKIITGGKGAYMLTVLANAGAFRCCCSSQLQYPL